MSVPLTDGTDKTEMGNATLCSNITYTFIFINALYALLTEDGNEEEEEEVAPGEEDRDEDTWQNHCHHHPEQHVQSQGPQNSL